MSRSVGRERPPGEPVVYRPIGPRVLLGVLVVIVGWWVVDLLVEHRRGLAVLTALWLVAVGCLLGCVFWRPAVEVDADGVLLRNVLRDVRVPWPALRAVHTRYALTLEAGGRRFQSWAAAAPARPSPARSLLGGRTGSGQGPRAGRSAEHLLPDPRWRVGDGTTPTSSSRDLRADSGAAAFLVEQRWQAWRERQASQPAEHAQPAGPDAAAPQVHWRLLLPGVGVAALILAVALTPVLG